MVVLLALLLFFGEVQPTHRQEANLYRYREAWTKATVQQNKDSIRQDVMHAIPELRVHHEQGQEQVQLWDLCCSMWDVVELFGESGRVNPLDLPSFAVHSFDGITFFSAGNEDSPTEDTTYLANNRLPGYGGIDVYFSPCHYYPTIDQHRWLTPTNIGRDINTGADEFGLKRQDSVFTFMRLVNGVVHKYRATPRDIVHDVDVRHTCATSNIVVLNVRDCRDNFTTSMAFDGTERMDLPPTAKTLEFRCCGNVRPRVFVRCDVTTLTLSLLDTDIRTHFCLHDGITTHAGGEQVFGFSVYEDAASAEAAFNEISGEIMSYVSSSSTVKISYVPGHLENELRSFVTKLQLRKINTEITETNEERTTIRVAQLR